MGIASEAPKTNGGYQLVPVHAPIPHEEPLCATQLVELEKQIRKSTTLVSIMMILQTLLVMRWFFWMPYLISFLVFFIAAIFGLCKKNRVLLASHIGYSASLYVSAGIIYLPYIFANEPLSSACFSVAFLLLLITGLRHEIGLIVMYGLHKELSALQAAVGNCEMGSPSNDSVYPAEAYANFVKSEHQQQPTVMVEANHADMSQFMMHPSMPVNYQFFYAPPMMANGQPMPYHPFQPFHPAVPFPMLPVLQEAESVSVPETIDPKQAN